MRFFFQELSRSRIIVVFSSLITSTKQSSAASSKPQSRGSETPVSAMGEDSNHSVMSESLDASEFTNKITNPPRAQGKEIALTKKFNKSVLISHFF